MVVVRLEALPLKTQTSVTRERPSHGALRFSSTPIGIRAKEILPRTTSQYAPTAGPLKCHWPAARLAFTPELSILLKDRNVHTARIVFQPPVLSVFLDGSSAPDLQTGASVPNPSGRKVVVTNAHGIVCWDLKARGSEGCSGPSASGRPAGAGFLAADAAPGALIMKTREEHTWFSVNGRNGVGFKDNEGFYEFDLEIK